MRNAPFGLGRHYDRFVETHPTFTYAQVVIRDLCRPFVDVMDQAAFAVTRRTVRFRRDIRRRITNRLMGYPS